jgi:putative sensory transduction regulator
MPTVETFNRGMIEKYLKANDLRFLKDEDGDFVVDFAYDEDCGCELSFRLLAEGQQSEIYVIRAMADKRIQKADWGRAIMLCNTWNMERRWPRSYLYVRDQSKDTTGGIVLEEQIDLEKGIHQELLDHYTDTVMSAAYSFWQWAHKEQNL